LDVYCDYLGCNEVTEMVDKGVKCNVVTARVSDELHKRLCAYAESLGVTVSVAVNELIREGLGLIGEKRI
jgi:hypothetical protein